MTKIFRLSLDNCGYEIPGYFIPIYDRMVEIKGKAPIVRNTRSFENNMREVITWMRHQDSKMDVLLSKLWHEIFNQGLDYEECLAAHGHTGIFLMFEGQIICRPEGYKYWRGIIISDTDMFTTDELYELFGVEPEPDTDYMEKIEFEELRGIVRHAGVVRTFKAILQFPEVYWLLTEHRKSLVGFLISRPLYKKIKEAVNRPLTDICRRNIRTALVASAA